MMHRNIRGCLLGALIALSLLGSGGVAANAADTTSGTHGLLSGTHAVAPFNTSTSLGATPLADTLPPATTAAVATPLLARPGTGLPAAQPSAINEGANGGLLVVGVLLLAFGGLLALILGRKRS